jgi:hypothetical protein
MGEVDTGTSSGILLNAFFPVPQLNWAKMSAVYAFDVKQFKTWFYCSTINWNILTKSNHYENIFKSDFAWAA